MMDMQLHRRCLDIWLRDRVAYGILAVLLVIFTVSGAFDSRIIESIPARAAFWLALIVELYLAFGLAGFVVAQLTGRCARESLLLEFLSALLASVMVAPAARYTLHMFCSETFDFHEVMLTAGKFAVVMPLLAAFLNIVSRQIENPPRQILHQGQSAGSSVAISRPADSPLYVEAEDHHVKLVFRDRVEIKRNTMESESANWEGNGLRVHRSYWVNMNAIKGRERDGRRLFLILANGIRIPVGRSYEAAILDLCRSHEREI